jgi:hypothetical protein
VRFPGDKHCMSHRGHRCGTHRTPLKAGHSRSCIDRGQHGCIELVCAIIHAAPANAIRASQRPTRIDALGQQAAVGREGSELVDRGQSVLRRQFDDQFAMTEYGVVRGKGQSTGDLRKTKNLTVRTYVNHYHA